MTGVDVEALRVLASRWRRLAAYEDEEGELEVGNASAVRLISCADELERLLVSDDRPSHTAGEK